MTEFQELVSFEKQNIQDANVDFDQPMECFVMTQFLHCFPHC